MRRCSCGPQEMGYDINPVWPDCNPGLGLIRECNDLTAQALVQQALNGTDGVDQCVPAAYIYGRGRGR